MINKQAVILTEGGRQIGFGHLSRCLALFQGFTEVKMQVRIIVNGDSYAYDFLKNQNVIPIMMNWIKEKAIIRNLARGVSLVVIDSYKAPLSFYRHFARYSCIMAIDDYNRLDYLTDFVVSPSIYGDKIKYRYSKETEYLLGRKYVILRQPFWKVPKKFISKQIKDILISFGGRGYEIFTTMVLGFLLENYPVFNYHVIGNKGKASDKVKFYSKLSAGQMRDLMIHCDLVISGGGQTLYELARVGVPVIGVRLADNQRMNLQSLQAQGALKYAGDYRQSRILEIIRKAMKSCISHEARKKSNIAAEAIVDGKGVRRIVRACIEAINSKVIVFRLFEKKDCRDLWLWRNSNQIKKWCFHTGKIKYDEHKQWFQRAMESKNQTIYIAENSRKQKVGQARFDKNSKQVAHINVNLNPCFLGLGLGGKVIRRATGIFMRQHPEIKKVIAEVKENNIAAKKAFLNAGYKRAKSLKGIVVFKSAGV